MGEDVRAKLKLTTLPHTWNVQNQIGVIIRALQTRDDTGRDDTAGATLTIPPQTGHRKDGAWGGVNYCN